MSWNEKLPLITILCDITSNEVLAHVQMLLNDGFKDVEISTKTPNWKQSFTKAVTFVGDLALIGAGTALNVAKVKAL